MTNSKLLHGRKFIDALIAKGVLPPTTTTLTIRASWDNVVRLDYEVIADEDLLAVVPAVEEEVH